MDSFNDKDDCAICLENIGDVDISITNCNHYFHTSCLLKIKKNECPLCKNILITDVEVEEVEDHFTDDFRNGVNNIINGLNGNPTMQQNPIIDRMRIMGSLLITYLTHYSELPYFYRNTIENLFLLCLMIIVIAVIFLRIIFINLLFLRNSFICIKNEILSLTVT